MISSTTQLGLTGGGFDGVGDESGDTISCVRLDAVVGFLVGTGFRLGYRTARARLIFNGWTGNGPSGIGGSLP